MDLKGKRILTTGDTRGSGEAIALDFARHGARLVINSRLKTTTRLRRKINWARQTCPRRLVALAREAMDVDSDIVPVRIFLPKHIIFKP